MLRPLTKAEFRQMSATNPGQMKKKKFIIVKNTPGLPTINEQPEVEVIREASGLKQGSSKSNSQVVIKVQDDDNNKDYLPSEKQPEIYVPLSRVEVYFKKICGLFEEIKFDIHCIDNKLGGPEQPKPIPEEAEYSILAHYLPIDNVESIYHFELLIKTDRDSVAQFKKMLTQTGGRTVKDNIHRSLRKIFTNSCALLCSWKGRKKNFRISNLLFVDIMKETFCAAFPSITEAQFETICSEWFRFAKQRLVREESRMNSRQDQNRLEKTS